MNEENKRLFNARAYFAKHCVEKQLFHTLCLLSCCEINVMPKLPFIAGLETVKRLQVALHPDMLDMFDKKPQAFCSIVFHELRHIIQMNNMLNAHDYVDLTPLYDKAVELKYACTDPEVQKHWDLYMAALDDRKNPETQRLLSSICNIGMDAADNVDVIKVWGEQATLDADAFCLERMTERGELAEGSTFLGAITPEKLAEIFGEPLELEQEWVYFSAKYVEYLAKQLKDPDKPPIMLVGLDQHGFGATSSNPDDQGDAKRTVNSALNRAAAEARVMAHRAGTTAADEKFMADTTLALNNKIKKLIDAMKFKIKKIFTASPEELYTFQKANRLWPTFDLPGIVNIDKPRPNVVLVIDVSGSMWRENWLNQMCSAARYLHKKKMLCAMYSFDTDLQVIPFDGKAPKVKLTGGGGTVWHLDFTDQILKDTKTKSFDMLLLSDMEICGLEGLSTDSRVKLHPINIGEFLGESD